MQSLESNNLLTMKQVMNLAGFRSRTTVYRRMELNCMPQPCQIGLGRLRWRERDIAAWIDGLEPKHDAGGHA
jgi:prophage regulatory protein